MKAADKSPIRLEEGLHFYIEHGKYVFTAYFLKARGYCCSNDCRHCPYKEKPIDETP